MCIVKWGFVFRFFSGPGDNQSKLAYIVERNFSKERGTFAISVPGIHPHVVMTGKRNMKNPSTKHYPNISFVSGVPQKARLLHQSTVWKNLDFGKA